MSKNQILRRVGYSLVVGAGKSIRMKGAQDPKQREEKFLERLAWKPQRELVLPTAPGSSVTTECLGSLSSFPSLEEVAFVLKWEKKRRCQSPGKGPEANILPQDFLGMIPAKQNHP